jgi:mannan endo-1,4-beta-mannosidase
MKNIKRILFSGIEAMMSTLTYCRVACSVSIVVLMVSAGFAQTETEVRVASITPNLATPEPIENATRLYNFLRDTYRKRILSGVMTLNSMDEVNWLKANTQKEPAIVGLDFMHCNRNYDWYNDEEPINDARTYYNRNGIPVFVWHWRDPSRKTEEFYASGTTFDISKVFDTNSTEYKAMIADIDYISALIKPLNEDGVPIIWRPLHEAAGGWFWWGAKGAAPCKKLFQVMFDRMVNHHGLKNLIWVWTREPDEDDKLPGPDDDDWYPGDAYVDIVGRDIYKDGDHSSHIEEFKTLNGFYGGKKMIAMTECGSMPDVDNLVKDGAGWLWFMPWYGKYTRESQYNSLTLWKKMFAHSYVVTLDEMPNLKTYESVVTSTEPSSGAGALQVYPTIIGDKRITVKGSKVIGDLTIFNNLGKQVEEHHVDSDTATINLSLLPGVYYMRSTTFGKTTRLLVK